MPKQSLSTLVAKQKVYLKLITQLQKDMNKVTKSIQSIKSKSVVEKPAAKKRITRKLTIAKKTLAKKTETGTSSTKKRGRPASLPAPKVVAKKRAKTVK